MQELARCSPPYLRPRVTQVVLGFDIEWRVHYERGRAPLPTALVQLCDANRVYLFHVARFKRPASPRLPEADQGQRQQDGSQQGWRPQWKLPQRLVDLLRSPTAVKVGVNVGGDLAKLHWDFEGLQGLRAAPAPAAGAVRLDRDSDEAGFVELSDFANQKLRRAGAGQRWSLRKLSEEILSRSLPKPNDIRCGEWDRDHLTAAQAQYAAADAVAARDIFFALNAKKDVRSPLRPRAQNQREVLRAGGAEGEEEIVPMLSCPATARLRPSAMRVWERFSGSADAGAVAKIADDLQLKESTCWNYIADGILHGLPYDWAQIKGLASLSEEVAAQIWAAAAVVAPKFCAAPHNLNWPRLTPIMENLQAQVGHSEESTTTNTGTEVETIADYRQIRLVLAHRCRVHAKATV
eukprot:SAG31_NODE_864_length_11392_cov_21.929868_5_plen_407_part_00